MSGGINENARVDVTSERAIFVFLRDSCLNRLSRLISALVTNADINFPYRTLDVSQVEPRTGL